MTPTEQDKELRERVEHSFVSAFQDGFGCARDPKYKNRTQLHTDNVMKLIQSYASTQRKEGEREGEES